MNRLQEVTIQLRAQEFLQRRYRWRAKGRRVYSQLEAQTRLRYGGKRADGVLVFQHWLFGPYLVSVEAKSFKTLSSFVPYRSDWKLICNSIWAGFLFLVATGGLFILLKKADGIFQFLVPFNFFIGGSLLYAIFTFSSYRHKVLDVVRQLQQYPANEQWLAFPRKSFSELSGERKKDLKLICRREGVGVLLVGPRDRIKIVQKPRMRWKWFGDYLSCYSNEGNMRQYINGL